MGDTEQKTFEDAVQREYVGTWVPVPPVSEARPEIKAKQALVDVKWTGAPSATMQVSYDPGHESTPSLAIVETDQVALMIRNRMGTGHESHPGPDHASDGAGGLFVYCGCGQTFHGTSHDVAAAADVVRFRRPPGLLSGRAYEKAAVDEGIVDGSLVRVVRDYLYPGHRGHGQPDWSPLPRVDGYEVSCGCGVGFHIKTAMMFNIWAGEVRADEPAPAPPTIDEAQDVDGPREKWIARKARAAGERDATRANMVAELELKGEVESLRAQLRETSRRYDQYLRTQPLRNIEVDDLRAKLKATAIELDVTKRALHESQTLRAREAAAEEVRLAEAGLAAELEAKGLATYGPGVDLFSEPRLPGLNDIREVERHQLSLNQSAARDGQPETFVHPRGALPVMGGGPVRRLRPAVFYCQNEED